ncbi:hypothetical protein ACIQAC_27345 [Streptomyces sp. NPDC088387]|uniref:hypothetical protein n=1 Tax=Streptomyces sp. NPDC088387 TaxID=3365859 RepID=UPI00381797F2
MNDQTTAPDPTTEPASALVPDSVSEPVSGPVARPVSGPVSEPVTGPGPDSVSEQVAGPIAGPVAALAPDGVQGDAVAVVPAPPPAPRDRRALRAAGRWVAAVAVFAVLGGATAYGISGMDREDVPGLATESDGRWDYPELTRPPLPSGSPGPLADSNPAGSHYADLRALLLPAPAGATQDKALRGADGWLKTEDYLAEFEAEYREPLGQKLADTGLRHIAARGWTTPDGIRTRIYLLQFGTKQMVDQEIASEALAFSAPTYSVRGSHDSVYDEHFPDRASVAGVDRTAYAEAKPYGAEQVREAYLAAGDVYAVILQSGKGGVPTVPFRQTVVLQSQLLG